MMSAEETVFENNLPQEVYGSSEPAPPTSTGRSNVYSSSTARSNVYDMPENLPQRKSRRPSWKVGVLRPQSESHQDGPEEIPRAPADEPEEQPRRRNTISPLTRIGVIIECVNNHPARVLPGSNPHAVWITCKECDHHFTWRLKDGRAPPFDLLPKVEGRLRDLWIKQCDAVGRPHA